MIPSPVSYTHLIACIASYYVAGMNLFDSFHYAMTTTATGGFSTTVSYTHLDVYKRQILTKKEQVLFGTCLTSIYLTMSRG